MMKSSVISGSRFKRIREVRPNTPRIAYHVLSYNRVVEEQVDNFLQVLALCLKDIQGPQ
jgi:hypothetical protein